MLENNLKKNIIYNKWILFILLISFGLSFFYSFYYQIKPQVDARAYDIIAQNIVNGNGYRENLDVHIKNDIAIVRAGPIYEFFLAGIYKIFGHSYPAVWILQAVLHAASAYLIYLICLLVFADLENKKKIALWGAAILGFYPDLIEISAMLMTETLYIFLICLFLYLFFLHMHNNKKITFIIFSVVFGLAVLTRPPVFFLIPVIFLYFFKKRQFIQILFFGIILIGVLAPWAIRNYYAYDKLMPFGAGGAYNFWIGNYSGGGGEQEPSPEAGSFFKNNSVVDSYEESTSQFKSFVLNYPGEFTKLTLLRVNKYFSILRPMGFWFYTSGWRQALFVLGSFIFSLAVFILSFGGILRSYKLNNIYIKYLLAFTIFTPLILFITVVETRYRFQIYPFLAIFAAHYISLFELDKKLWFKNLLVPSIVILLIGLVDGLLNFNSFKDKIFSHFD